MAACRPPIRPSVVRFVSFFLFLGPTDIPNLSCVLGPVFVRAQNSFFALYTGPLVHGARHQKRNVVDGLGCRPCLLSLRQTGQDAEFFFFTFLHTYIPARPQLHLRTARVLRASQTRHMTDQTSISHPFPHHLTVSPHYLMTGLKQPHRITSQSSTPGRT